MYGQSNFYPSPAVQGEDCGDDDNVSDAEEKASGSADAAGGNGPEHECGEGEGEGEEEEQFEEDAVVEVEAILAVDVKSSTCVPPDLFLVLEAEEPVRKVNKVDPICSPKSLPAQCAHVW